MTRSRRSSISDWYSLAGIARGSIFDRAIERGELPAETDVELALDLLYGPVYHRFLQGHLPLSRGVRGSGDRHGTAWAVASRLSGAGPAIGPWSERATSARTKSEKARTAARMRRPVGAPSNVRNTGASSPTGIRRTEGTLPAIDGGSSATARPSATNCTML